MTNQGQSHRFVFLPAPSMLQAQVQANGGFTNQGLPFRFTFSANASLSNHGQSHRFVFLSVPFMLQAQAQANSGIANQGPPRRFASSTDTPMSSQGQSCGFVFLPIPSILQAQANGSFATQFMPFTSGVNQDNEGGTTQGGSFGFVFPLPFGSGVNRDNGSGTTQGRPHGFIFLYSLQWSLPMVGSQPKVLLFGSGVNQDNGSGATQGGPRGFVFPPGLHNPTYRHLVLGSTKTLAVAQPKVDRLVLCSCVPTGGLCQWWGHNPRCRHLVLVSYKTMMVTQPKADYMVICSFWQSLPTTGLQLWHPIWFWG